MHDRGYFCLTMYVAALPVNMASRLWDLDITDGRLEVEDSAKTELVSYRELTDMWERGEDGQFGEFEELLVVACKGLDARNHARYL